MTPSLEIESYLERIKEALQKEKKTKIKRKKIETMLREENGHFCQKTIDLAFMDDVVVESKRGNDSTNWEGQGG